MIKKLARAAGLGLAVAAMSLLPQQAAFAASNDSDGGNTGVANTGPATYEPPSWALPGLAEKDRKAAELRAALAQQSAATAQGGDTVASPNVLPPGGGGYPSSYNAPGWGFTIHKEGEGNPCAVGSGGCSSIGHKYYTCGPAATRNMVQGMTGTNTAELTFEQWEQTVRPPSQYAGTNISNIAATLNNHYSSYGSWKLLNPGDQGTLMSYVMSDLYNYHQGLVQNVDTGYLSFFNGHSLTHYDTIYGYSSSTAVNIAEEWDPKYTYGSTPSYGDPYGMKTGESLTKDFNAVHYSPSHELVI